MKLGTKTRYAVLAILDLAISSQNNQCIILSSIATRQQISVSYLEQLFSKLKQKNIVISTKGPKGGYKLAKKTSEITLKDIVSAVDEKIETTQCKGRKNCSSNQTICMTHHLWEDLSEKINEYLESMSLETILKNQKQFNHNSTNHNYTGVIING